MKIKFIGTGSILTRHFSASVLIDSFIQIDVPNGYCKKARAFGVDINRIDVILLTHFHGDHYFDFPFLLLEMGLRSERTRELLVIGPRGLEEQLKRLHSFAYDNWDKVNSRAKTRYVEIDGEGNCQKLGGYEIEAISVDHVGLDAYGFLISNGVNVLGYTGDTQFCSAVEHIVSRSDAIIVDASFVEGRVGHMGLDNARALAQSIAGSSKMLIGNHMTDQARAHVIDFKLLRPNDGDEISLV